MPENKPFVINDRRKFTADGELRPDAPHDSSPQETPEKEARTEEVRAPETRNEERRNDNVTPFEVRSHSANAEPATRQPEPAGETFVGQAGNQSEEEGGEELPPPTSEESEQVARAYEATVDRLDTALRATNPGGERLPPMTFERLVQSLYMQALLQLGGAAEPGQPPRVDLIGARQTIDMLSVVTEKVKGNLTENEDKLLQSALFELRMGFLEVTQALARQAASRQPGAGTTLSGGPVGPSIVR